MNVYVINILFVYSFESVLKCLLMQKFRLYFTGMQYRYNLTVVSSLNQDLIPKNSKRTSL